MTDYQEIFIKNLKALRKERKLTQSQLAELCEVSNGTIGNIECGMTKPSFDLLVKFAAIMKVPPSRLFHSEEAERMERMESARRIKSDLIDFIEREFERYT